MPITATDDASFDDYGPVSDAQYDYIIRLLDSSVFDELQRCSFRVGLKDLDQSNVQEIIGYLQLNQLNPVTQGANASMREINNFLKKSI